MENKINIAEILRDVPKGTKLYSPLLGEVKFKEVVFGNIFPIKVLPESPNLPTTVGFTENGFFYDDIEDAEALLLPSREMRDWSKLFKRGDVVRNHHNEMVAVFDGWANDDYTEFNTTINYYANDCSFGEEEVCDTECFANANDAQKALFIAAAEKHYGGKYNPETLQVVPVKEPKCPFKPFDKVLARCNEDSVWRCELFSHYNTFNKQCHYVCLSSVYKYCIPYEGNQHLLGTTNNPK